MLVSHLYLSETNIGPAIFHRLFTSGYLNRESIERHYERSKSPGTSFSGDNVKSPPPVRKVLNRGKRQTRRVTW